DGLLPDRDAADVVVIELVAEAGLIADFEGAPRSGFDGWLNDVLLPIALAGGDVTGKNEIGEGGERDVVRASDAGFEHAAAPHRDARGLRHVMHTLGFGKATHAAQFDINDAAGPQTDGLLGMVC